MSTTLILVLILWLLMGLCAGLIAAQKGRSGGAFGIMGFLLGPIGIIIALAAESYAAPKVKRPQESVHDDTDLAVGVIGVAMAVAIIVIMVIRTRAGI